jgi:hypothetical protein
MYIATKDRGISEILKPNGPAIWGGCVTWRRHPATGPGALAEK